MHKRLLLPLLFLLAYASLSVLYGCVTSNLYSDYYTGEMQRVAVSDPSYYSECKIGECWCMVCERGEDDIPFFDDIFDSLVGGSCHFDKECTQQRVSAINDELEGENVGLRHFMIGIGPSFTDAGSANPYCKNRLNMAVQWLTGNNETPYDLPEAGRAICLIDKGIIPVYVLYSKGENIDTSRTRRIASVLGTEGRDFTLGRLTDGPVGPVVVTTEMNYDISQADAVAEQVRMINEGCDNDRANNKIHCMVAVAPKINDAAALDAVLSRVGDQVDLVAYGIDYRYIDSCNGGDFMEAAVNFSSYALYTWGKPSIIPYIMFDSSGSSPSGKCDWSEGKMIAAYKMYFPDGAILLQQKGVIGLAPYSFNSTSYGTAGNPLGCNDCALGKSERRMRDAWFAGCQAYTDISRVAPGGATVDQYRSGGTQIRFPNESAGFCDENLQFDFMYSGFEYPQGDIMNPQAAEYAEPEDLALRCDACLTWTNKESPFEFESISLGPETLNYTCHNITEIDYWANQRGVDPMLMRALIYFESDFDPCAVPKVCAAGYDAPGGSQGCFARVDGGASECYDKGIGNMTDPAGVCIFDEPDTNIPQRYRWCSMGLTASNEPPYTYWNSTYYPGGVDGEYYLVLQDAERRGWGGMVLDVAKGCNPEFNPFNVTDSLCVGTWKVQDMLRRAREWIEANQPYLNWDVERDFETTNAFAGYVAMNMYGGFWNARINHDICGRAAFGDCMAAMFKASWEVDSELCTPESGESLDDRCSAVGVPDDSQCYGYTDFVKYVRECEMNNGRYTGLRQVDPGSKKMGLYYHLKENCDNAFCPDWTHLYDAATDTMPGFGESHPIPGSGSIYIPD